MLLGQPPESRATGLAAAGDCGDQLSGCEASLVRGTDYRDTVLAKKPWRWQGRSPPERCVQRSGRPVGSAARSIIAPALTYFRAKHYHRPFLLNDRVRDGNGCDQEGNGTGNSHENWIGWLR